MFDAYVCNKRRNSTTLQSRSYFCLNEKRLKEQSSQERRWLSLSLGLPYVFYKDLSVITITSVKCPSVNVGLYSHEPWWKLIKKYHSRLRTQLNNVNLF